MSNDFQLCSPMKRAMLTVLAVSLAGTAAFGALHCWLDTEWLLSCAITCGTTAFHILLRLFAPVIVRAAFRRRYNVHHWWFRTRAWEMRLYDRIGVQKWKSRVPAWDPSQFSLEKHSLQQIAQNMCHAELVHEFIVVLSFTSLLLAIPFGTFPVFLITAVLAAAFDSIFVMVQRHNRPRIVAILDRRLLRTQRAGNGDQPE